MMWRIACVLILGLSMVGCHNNDVESPVGNDDVTIATRRGPVVIDNIRRDDDRAAFSARVTGTDINATLRVVAAGDGVATTGGTAMLVDDSGRVLFLLEVTLDRANSEIVYRQETEDDYLKFSLREENDRIRESYDANGDAASFEYPALPYDTQRRALNHLEHGLSNDHLPADVREYVTEAGAFREYYRPHSASSIHHNEAGLLLVELLASVELGKVIGDGMTGDRSKIIETFCNMVTACATFACGIWPGNPICTACAGAAIACQIFNILSIWIPGWN